MALLAAVLLTTAGCGGPSEAEQEAAKPVKLVIWRVFDDDDAFRPAMNAYRELHKNVSFEYRTLRYDEYEDELLRAFAEGNGPDIFSLHHTWMGKYESLVLPLPKTLTIPYTEVRGTVKKETVVTLKEEPAMTVREMESTFVDAVADDMVRDYRPNPKQEAEKRIFGIPLSMDTLALFYNKELLNAGGISVPPATWGAFQEASGKLTVLGANDAIVQSGAALGTAHNVERAFDILSLLMLQNGTPMADDRGNATFARELEDKSVPGADATRFYAEFANPLKAVYSWNAEQPSSFDAFAAGNAAMFLGYSYHLPLLRARAPKLDFGIAPVPQIDGGRAVNYANFWTETVSKATKHPDWAWDFIQFAAAPDRVDEYLTETNKPTALRELVNGQLQDDDLSVFASQLLTAKTWYRGKDAGAAEEAILNLIDATVAGGDLARLIRDAQNKVNQTL